MAAEHKKESGAGGGVAASTLLNWAIWAAAIVVLVAIVFQLVSKLTREDRITSSPQSESPPEEQDRQMTIANPADHRAHFRRARFLQSQGRLEEAVESYRTAISLRDDVAGYHNDLASALAMQEKFDEAIEHFRTALTIEPDNVKALFNLGTALYSSGNLEEAILQFRRVIEIDPGHARAHNNLAVALKDSGQLEAAFRHRHEANRLEREQQTYSPE